MESKKVNLDKYKAKPERIPNNVDLSAIKNICEVIAKYELWDNVTYHGGSVFCPKCGDNRTVNIKGLYFNRHLAQMVTNSAFPGGPTVTAKDYCPSLLKYECLQCGCIITVLLYNGPDGPSLILLPNSYGQFATPGSPDSVKYYLAEAFKSYNAGANSAAVTMFRAALEHVLYDKGYKEGLLKAKIDLIDKEIQNNSAPKWIKELNTEVFDIIRELGNGAIHTNQGDIDLQKQFDNHIVNSLSGVFKILLWVAYEKDSFEKQQLESLKKVTSTFKTNKNGGMKA